MKSRAEELQAELIKIRQDEEMAKGKKLDDESIAAYERCKNSVYTRHDSDYPHWIEYRKVSNFVQSTQYIQAGERHVTEITVHERIGINYRVNNLTAFGYQGDRHATGADIEIFDTTDSQFPKNFLKRNEIPVSEEEYFNAKKFVENIIALQQKFFENLFKTS
jgi:hypothetical protein